MEHYFERIAPEHTEFKRIRDEAKRINLDKLTMDEIDAEIAVFRFEKRLNF
jgi:hypothetical protein